MVAVTVVVPIYNGSRLLPETLASLRAQTLQDVEFLCVDDCSTDHSRDLVRAIEPEDTRFRLISRSTNAGTVSRVINSVLDEIRGGYFAYTSQDDLHSTEWLEKMLRRGRNSMRM